MPPAALAPPVPAGRSAPWLRRAVLPAVAIAAMLCGAGSATAVTLLVVRDGQPPTQRYEVRVSLNVAATAEQKAAVESDLSARYPTGTVRLESREEAYENFKEVYKDAPDLVRTVAPSSLPESFLVTTTANAFDCAVLSPVERMDGVEDVRVRRLADGGRPDAAILGCP